MNTVFQVDTVIHGFSVLSARPVDEIGAILYELEYKKNGAKLVWLAREDGNKTFSVTFKTIPSDDTGVFHILEHSVLGGSEKYPVKEPFVELLKGSMQTFLNAFTFPDKTMYPVCSRNDKDFLNLIDVYMDAVLHPTIYTKPETFWQEGWHYELFDKNEPLLRNGVVYNEMQGAFSSVETIIMSNLNRLLFPNNCYQYESGGDPESIPNLTYEQFLEAHRTFYHPSNAKFFLDGNIDMETVLAKLDEYLSCYEFMQIDTDIPMQSAVSPQEFSCEYEVTDDEDLDKIQYAEGYVFASFAEQEKLLAMDILIDAVCGSNEAPLKKAILSQNLADDIYLSTSGTQQVTAMIVARNVQGDNLNNIKEVIKSVLGDLCNQGIDRELLNASFNNLEFAVKERDYGSMPQGIGFAMSVFDSWLYGGDPAQNLSYNDVFTSLRNKLGEGYFEQLLRDAILENAHKASVVLRPSVKLGGERKAKNEKALAEIKSHWSEQDISNVISMSERLKKAQETPDSEEMLAKLPMLALDDISKEPEDLPINEVQCGQNTVLLHEIETGGIIYADIYFAATDLSKEELSLLSLLCEILTQTGTENFSALDLNTKIKAELGFLSVSPAVYCTPGNTEECRPYVIVGCGFLESKIQSAIELIKEVIQFSKFDDTQLIKNIIAQRKLSIERGFVSSGSSFAARRIASASTAHGVASGALSGLEFYRYLRKIETQFQDDPQSLTNSLCDLCKRLFVGERATFSIIGSDNLSFAEQLIAGLPHSNEARFPSAARYDISPIRREGIITPSSVAFAAKGANIYNLGLSYSGSLRVATSLLSLGYLWNAIRVQGGAYGTGVSANINGMVCFTSYRDPNAAASLDYYDKAGDALRAFCDSDEDTVKYIIGTIAETEPVMSNKQRGRSAAALYMSGVSYETRKKTREEILATTKADLRAIGELLDRVCRVNNVCVVGQRSKLEDCGDRLDTLSSIK